MIPSSLKNTDGLPASMAPLLAEFTGKLLEHLNDNVLSMVVYGSAAGDNYDPAVSDINIAVIVRQLDFLALKASLETVKWGRKRRISTPLFLTKEYILNSLDVFPIEFMEIKQRHKLIYGEDIFKDLDVPVKDVRLLCEQQIKGKLLRLRQAYLEIGPNPGLLRNLVSSALNDLVPVFRQLIVLKGQAPVESKEEMLQQLAAIFSLDEGPFLVLHRHKAKKIVISLHEVEAHLQNFLSQLEHLSRHLDSL